MAFRKTDAAISVIRLASRMRLPLSWNSLTKTSR